MLNNLPTGMHCFDFLTRRHNMPPIDTRLPLGGMDPRPMPDYRGNNLGHGWIDGDNTRRRLQNDAFDYIPPRPIL